jgi:tRNA C32,U32 (ribose-2'-O)-methylase TrmJ
MVCCYELFLLANNPSYAPPEECSPEADGKLRERLYEAWSGMMLETGFCEKEKLDHMMLGLRRIFSRGKLTKNDAKILLGLAKQSRWVAAELERLRAER